MIRRFAIAAFAALVLLAPPRSFAQGLDLNQNSDQPVDIEADQGIEWHRDDQTYIARGNAVAKRGDVTLHADTLTAHYRPVEGGGTDIYQVDAVGNVVIVSGSGTAQGDNGVYDMDSGVLVLKGHNLKIVSDTYTVTARDTLEYWDNKQMLVARGDAVAVNEDKRMTGNILTAYFTNAGSGDSSGGGKTQPGAKQKAGAGQTGADGNRKIRRIEGFTDVHVSTPGQIAVGDKGVYDVESGIATLFGSVKITREDNQLNGEYGEVNLNTGVSRLLSGAPGEQGPQRVHGLFSPKKKPEVSSGDQQSAPGGSTQAPQSVPRSAPAAPAATTRVPTQAPPPVP